MAAAVAWHALSGLDFGYPLLYEWLDIGAHIERYGPQNRYRDGFETTTDGERQALFADMLQAINNDGAGLRALHYETPQSGRPIALLRPPEIAHLQLVAGLVGALRVVGVLATILLGAAVSVLRLQRSAPHRGAEFAGAALSLGGLGFLGWAAFDAGGGGWFARLHELVFPPGHQWFFYYQESLMTTLLKAPDIFGPMGLELGLLTGVIGALALGTVEAYLKRHG